MATVGRPKAAERWVRPLSWPMNKLALASTPRSWPVSVWPARLAAGTDISLVNTSTLSVSSTSPTNAEHNPACPTIYCCKRSKALAVGNPIPRQDSPSVSFILLSSRQQPGIAAFGHLARHIPGHSQVASYRRTIVVGDTLTDGMPRPIVVEGDDTTGAAQPSQQGRPRRGGQDDRQVGAEGAQLPDQG